MKQGKLIRRAVSAALAGCMMFTFSAPALAESTDALLQQSAQRVPDHVKRKPEDQQHRTDKYGN